MNLKIKKAIENIIQGKLVAIPTDTYFALGANGLNPSAIKKYMR